MNITLDYSLLLNQNIGENGLDLAKLQSNKMENIYEKVNFSLIKGGYPFVEMLKTRDNIEACKQVFSQISWAKQMIVVGIGGADLGAKMLQKALQIENPPMQVLFAGDTTDPDFYVELERKIDYQNCVVNVISKSGTTVETISGYLFLKAKFEQKLGDDWAKHFIFTTDKNEGILRQEADKFGLVTLPTPDGVGDRFAVLSCLGLFPALVMGIDIDALVDSAYKTLLKLANKEMFENPAWIITHYQYLLSQEKNINTVVMMPYAYRLDTFALWFRQIWAESLGKKGQGILPIKAQGPADDHSQLQYYNQGKVINSFIFLSIKNYKQNYELKNTGIDQLNNFNQKDLQSIIQTEAMSTQTTLANHGRPSAHFQLEKLDEEHLGALIAIFQLSTLYMAGILNVNPFDQPGVEDSRQYMYGLLDKPGFEHKAEEIRQKVNQINKKTISLT
jgi:glucose-6-phosphate isomerase